MKSERRRDGAISSWIGFVFLLTGILALIYSIFSENQILAFTGLSLTFWGALFFLARPVGYLRGDLLSNSMTSSYLLIDNIIRDFGYDGKGYYMPPFPKDIHLPDYLKGYKDFVVFISATDNADLPSIEEISKSEFALRNSKGLLITALGRDLLTLIEEESKIDFTKIQPSKLPAVLINSIQKNFNLATDIQIEFSNSQVYLKILDSIYKKLYSPESDLKSISILGCPIVSAVACALAKVSGEAVAIQNLKKSPDNSTIEVWYQFLKS